MSDEEVFEQSYWNFFDALELMAEEAETQCKIMNYYNVAWELKDDIIIGYCLLKIASGKLSDVQQSAIRKFLVEVEKLPGHLFIATTTERDNLNAMSHSSWVPIRKHAVNLIQILEPATKRNKAFYGYNEPA